MITFELTPQNGRKSFYGKAIVEKEGNKYTLKSYGTVAAVIEDGEIEIFNLQSNTTCSHVKSFCKLYGFDYEKAAKKYRNGQ